MRSDSQGQQLIKRKSEANKGRTLATLNWVDSEQTALLSPCSIMGRHGGRGLLTPPMIAQKINRLQQKLHWSLFVSTINPIKTKTTNSYITKNDLMISSLSSGNCSHAEEFFSLFFSDPQ